MTIFVNLEFYATGSLHTQYKQVADQLKVGQEVELVRNPENQYDKYATKIMFPDHPLSVQIGWVPQKSGASRFVAEALDKGMTLSAVITKLKPDSKWGQIKVWIKDSITAQGLTTDIPLTEGMDDDDTIPY